jgi:hypothetical protein
MIVPLVNVNCDGPPAVNVKNLKNPPASVTFVPTGALMSPLTCKLPAPVIVNVAEPLNATESGIVVPPVVASADTTGLLAVGGTTARSPAVGMCPKLQLPGVVQTAEPPVHTLSVDALALANENTNSATATNPARPIKRTRPDFVTPRIPKAPGNVTISLLLLPLRR